MTPTDRRQHWDPQPGDAERIREHIKRQRGLNQLRQVRLDDGRVVPVGEDAEGEADEHE